MTCIAGPAVAVTAVRILLTVSPGRPTTENTWSGARRGRVLQIAYGNEVTGWPQMAALHMNTGALRMVYGPDSGWGATVYVPPSLWTGSGAGKVYHLGAPVAGNVSQDGDDLVLDLNGRIGGLAFASKIQFYPPAANRFEAQVSMTTSGSVTLPDRPGEAFKPVHVASMKISNTQWDSRAARVGAQDFPIPTQGWVLDPPGLTGAGFTLVGGSSEWKNRGPTITITLDRDMTLQGWAARSKNPNDDNIGFWCASGMVLNAWQYKITATP